MKVFLENLIIFSVATLCLAAFNADYFVTWSYDLPPGDLSDAIVAGAEAWASAMEDIGLSAITEEIRYHVSVMVRD
ncbi:MAG: hypothetical protein AAGE61_13530 [Pseudomonadota bacterium]